MAMSVRERIKEIGVLKTLGFTTTQVLAMIIAESVLIAMIGGLIGCALAYALCQGVSRANLPFLQFGLPMPPMVVTISLAVAFAIGFLSSVFPAFNASRVPITEALRHVG
jgi:putative ABC transport system permease protein